MATLKWEGLDVFLAEMKALENDASKICKMALYDGAKVLHMELQSEISGLKELNAKQRAGLHKGCGVAKFWEERGNTVTRVGFDGYNEIKTKRWPNGQPNVMVARSLIRGTSWLPANRFTSRAVKKAREKAIEAMRRKVEDEINLRMKRR